MWTNQSIVFDPTICRLCGCNSEHNINFFSTDTSSDTHDGLITKMRRLLPLDFEETDKKPKQICNNCCIKLEDFDSFVSLCLGTDSIFCNILNTTTNSKCPNIMVNQSGECVVLIQKNNNEADTNLVLLDKENSGKTERNPEMFLMLELNYRSIQPSSTVGIPEILKPNTAVEAETKDENICNVFPDKHNEQSQVKEKSKEFACDICHKKLARRSNLVTHMTLHTEERPYKCKDCDKTFAHSWDLTLHTNIHTRTFVCDVCDKPFITKSKLERHKITHTGEKKFVCTICNKKFGEKNNMLIHLTVHTGVKKYSCNTCKKSFRVRSHLNGHLKVHSSNAPFKCNICSKSFKWKTNLKDHIKGHSGEQFKCNKCFKEYKQRSDYYQHRKQCKIIHESQVCYKFF